MWVLSRQYLQHILRWLTLLGADLIDTAALHQQSRTICSQNMEIGPPSSARELLASVTHREASDLDPAFRVLPDHVDRLIVGIDVEHA